MKRLFSAALAALMLTASVTGCASTGTDTANQTNGEEVTLTVAGPWPECTALDNAAAAFHEKYPNCTVVYEYIQNFDENLPKRLASDTEKLDLFLTNNIQNGNPLLEYSLDLSTVEGDTLDLSHTFAGLVNNFRLQSENEADKNKLYSIPLGGEVRGMFVNKTLLSSLGLEVPTNRTELLNACETLKQAGYIPLHDNPGSFGVQLMYPYICNLIANADDYEAAYAAVDSRADGVSETFRDPMEFLYTIMENDYYKYKYVETELNLFTDMSNEACARSFLNVVADDSGNYSKLDDLGQVAFMPFTQSLESVLAKTKDDYHSAIEYEFILSPVSEDGGYGYLSPGRSIAVSNASDHTDWALNFLNFLFEEDNNTALCEQMGLISNTTDALDVISERFDVPASHISQLGQVTFSYDFYSVIEDTLVEISKGNNPKYMSVDADGNPALYPFSYYMENFEQRFHAQE